MYHLMNYRHRVVLNNIQQYSEILSRSSSSSSSSSTTTTTTTTHEQRVCTRELNNFLTDFSRFSSFLTRRGQAHTCKHKCTHLSTQLPTTKNGTKKKKKTNNSNKLPGSLLSTPLHYTPLFLHKASPGTDKAQQGVEHNSKGA